MKDDEKKFELNTHIVYKKELIRISF